MSNVNPMLIYLRDRHLDEFPINDRKSATILKRHVFVHVETGYIAEGKIL